MNVYRTQFRANADCIHRVAAFLSRCRYIVDSALSVRPLKLEMRIAGKRLTENKFTEGGEKILECLYTVREKANEFIIEIENTNNVFETNDVVLLKDGFHLIFVSLPPGVYHKPNALQSSKRKLRLHINVHKIRTKLNLPRKQHLVNIWVLIKLISYRRK